MKLPTHLKQLILFTIKIAPIFPQITAALYSLSIFGWLALAIWCFTSLKCCRSSLLNQGKKGIFRNVVVLVNNLLDLFRFRRIVVSFPTLIKALIRRVVG